MNMGMRSSRDVDMGMRFGMGLRKKVGMGKGIVWMDA